MTIKKKIYWGFYILAFVFVINGIVTISILKSNQKRSEHISEVTDPSIKEMDEFRKILLESEMFATNWVHVRSSHESKDALIKLHTADYPALKVRLSLLL